VKIKISFTSEGLTTFAEVEMDVDTLGDTFKRGHNATHRQNILTAAMVKPKKP
jgi:hypothetical protein